MSQLEKNIALNLKRIRKSHHMSLDMMAEKTGVSKSMLGQIERGESNPTISTIGKIVEGLRIPFEALLYMKGDNVLVMQSDEFPVCREREQEYQFKQMIPFEQTGKFELLSVRLEAETECQNPPHHEGTVEYVTVIQGRLLLSVGEEEYVVEEQQAVRFHTTQNYFYKNHGKTPLLLQVVISHEQISAD